MALNHKNKGYTLVELVVVIAIIGILAGTLTISVSTVSSGRARRAAQAMDDMLSQCRVLTLSGATAPRVEVTLEGGDYHAALYLGGILRDRETLGGAELQIEYTAGGMSRAITALDPLTLTFNPTTGALDGACTAVSVGSYTVSITPSTGYHRVVK